MKLIHVLLSCVVFLCFEKLITASHFNFDDNGNSMSSEQAVNLNDDFRVLWTTTNEEITFELQVRTLGYIGFGFSNDGNIAGSDIAIGWIDRGHTFFQDRYVPKNNSLEPIVDQAQDYILIKGYENSTHTVIKFRRMLDTCDRFQDISITNKTMRVLYMYSDKDPENGSVHPGSLPKFNEAWSPTHSLIFLEKQQPILPSHEQVRSLELRNQNVKLPYFGDTLFWCQMFELDAGNKKQHLVKYEPIYDSSWSIHFLQQITLYECQESHIENEQLSRGESQMCNGENSVPISCNAIVAAWARGSNGFTFPIEVGYPLELQQSTFYFMVSQYNNMKPEFNHLNTPEFTDNSGIKIYLTNNLRLHDAGILSVGIEPNWHHIIPPGQKRVLSEGQCLEECTQFAFPHQGINIFAVMMRTHQIGKEIKLRQIRKVRELPPIAQDSNINANYQGFRHLTHTINSLPGDRLIAECIYDSSSRKELTLGGLGINEESCTVLSLYYPRQKKLTTCHSLPSLSTVLNSLGIESLAKHSNSVVISAPKEFHGMAFETRLLTYDWQKHFNAFQKITSEGSFNPLCWGAHKQLIPISGKTLGHKLKVAKPLIQQGRCKRKTIIPSPEPASHTEIELQNKIHGRYSGEISARSSRSSLIGTLALSASRSSSFGLSINFTMIWAAYLFLLLS